MAKSFKFTVDVNTTLPADASVEVRKDFIHRVRQAIISGVGQYAHNLRELHGVEVDGNSVKE